MKSVTATNCLAETTFNKCNVTGTSSTTQVLGNKCNGQRCEQCGHLFCETETIYRRRVYIREGETFYPEWKGWERYITHLHRDSILSVCENCVGKYFDNDFRLNEVRNCEYCSRPVVRQRYRRYKQHAFCCNRCESGYYSRKQSERRAASRTDMACITCGDLFTPKRSDAVTCSNKCRQKMYRAEHKNTEQTTNCLVSA